MLKKLSGGFLLVLGYLLSPLCWWNDIVFNLPIAYGFGWLCHLFYSPFLIPGTVIGYWISNVIGMLLIQFGTVDLMQKSGQERNFKKELFNGLVASTAYTLLMVALIQLKILDASSLLSMIANHP
jgi:uncharacterized membrane protein